MTGHTLPSPGTDALTTSSDHDRRRVMTGNNH
jgi:hypothetical protein